MHEAGFHCGDSMCDGDHVFSGQTCAEQTDQTEENDDA